MKSLSLAIGKIYETNYCFGVVLSDGFEAMEDEVRSFVLSQSQAINTFVQSKVPRLEVISHIFYEIYFYEKKRKSRDYQTSVIVIIR